MLAAGVFALLALVAAPGAAFEAPLQVDLAVDVRGQPGAGRRFATRIDPGEATLSGRVRNHPRGDTARVTLVFDYRVPPGTIALDELIEGIEITVEDAGANVHGEVALDTALVHLNPNRARLRYAATLYYPPGESYVLRVRVYGNYE